MLGLSACGKESTDPREMVAATRTEFHARIAEFSRPARPTDRPPVDLIADAERLCRVSAVDGPPLFSRECRSTRADRRLRAPTGCGHQPAGAGKMGKCAVAPRAATIRDG